RRARDQPNVLNGAPLQHPAEVDFAGGYVFRSVGAVGRDLSIPIADEAAIELKGRCMLEVRSVCVQQSLEVGHVALLFAEEISTTGRAPTWRKLRIRPRRG